MAPAWLDSLSEDWVSQPGSDTSAVQLPSLHSTQSSRSQRRQVSSRQCCRARNGMSSLPLSNENSINVLSERSANGINISRQRTQSRLSLEMKAVPENMASRSCSVVHNTVNHQESATNEKKETPEWKRRLIHGEIRYGEQRDLFSSAAVGLQDMFKPPNSADSPGEGYSDEYRNETTLPSSPPPFPRAIGSPDLTNGIDESDDEPEYPEEVTPSPSPRRSNREFKYQLNDEFASSNESKGFSVLRDETPVQPKHNKTRQDDSRPSDLSAVEGNTRKTSGQSDTRNEDFSPILIGKHSDEDGKVDFAPIELPADQLRQMLENLRINQMLLDSEADPEAAFDATNQEEPLNVETTEDYARNGGFINFRRGGRSADGSFRVRGLSPAMGMGDSSDMLPEESLQASTPKQFPTIRTENANGDGLPWGPRSPSIPRAPFPSPEKRPRRGDNQSGGSPLKLFGVYDTFTNQTLLRRISQFEEDYSGSTSHQLDSSFRPKTTLSHAGDLSSSIQDETHQGADDSSLRSRSVGRFGVGSLEDFQFNGDISYASNEASVLDDNKENVSPPTLPQPKAPFFHQPRDSSPNGGLELRVRRRRNKSLTSQGSRHSRNSSLSSRFQHSMNAKGMPALAGTPKRDAGSESKRPRTSPSKDPTPKRRRTLHRSDIAFGQEEQTNAVDTAHQQIQHAMGKKRKDARPGGFELADPEVLAMRSILRPRTPTPRQRPSKQHERDAAAGSGQMSPSERPRRSPARANPGEDSMETNRKPSIRTQDFVDQAAQIMAMIRNQVRAPGLASLEESEAENGAASPDILEESYQESTKEPFSRPPSREGKPLPRAPQRQEDPEVVNRLKQYQELSDMGDIISSSMRSVGLAKHAIRAAQEVERRLLEADFSRTDGPLVVEGDLVSDLSNIRLSTNPAQHERAEGPDREYPSNSSGRLTNQTFPTTSSRGSDSRKVIMPESVSHLIPDRVGSMFLDKQNNIWIKKKESPQDRTRNVLPSEDSEDDPFASIPDLTVDLTRELQTLKIGIAQKRDSWESPGQTNLSTPSSTRQSRPSRSYLTLSPNSQLSPDVSAVAREELEKLDMSPVANPENAHGGDGSHHHGDGRSSHDTRRRNMTISFSSPIASIIHEVAAEDLDSLEDDPDTWYNHIIARDEEATSDTKSKQTRQSLRPSNNRQSTRQGPLQSASFIPRPVSRIDEQDEESTVELPFTEQRQISIIGETSIMSHKTPNVRRTSVSLILNHTPGNGTLAVTGDDSVLIGKNVGKLSLSPLSEFTLNNSDQSFGLEVSYVMGHRHMETGDGSRKVLPMTIRALVDKLSEVEPCEPYWEDLTQLDLHDKRLSSLHMLDEFCGKLVTLDASNNTLGHLDGVPSTVRHLKMSCNMLTELTSWDHLMNLQYVDISGNEIRSLSALKNLVHLRSLKADNNQLTSLEGLDVHDGLLSLRARGNLIEKVDFATVTLPRLTELDLGGNKISSVENLGKAPALQRLRLQNNQLQSLSLKGQAKTLRELNLDDNKLTCLDISGLTNLHTLHADRNHLQSLSGFQHVRRLDSLSLREQRGDEQLDLVFLSKAYEIRKLFLSGNYLGAFEPSVDFLNLQLLELANCGIQALPANLGQLMPNLRTLNVNFNAISDLRPLRYIPRLKKLLAAGNRLVDSTAVIELLTEFPHLTQLDLRDNPVTQGFYAPIQVLVPTDRVGIADAFTLPDVEVGRDAQYASRLDETTKLRRRLHQIVFVASCKRLRKLDGLAVSREEVLRKDTLIQALIADGVLPEPEETLVELCDAPRKGDEEVMVGGEERQSDTLRSSRWGAEDSFA
ncbi:hypothetical protein S40288_03952 [Stachybotrys chartarum IBT 40288]|nr:hypothetical protein S40288_03952 [Stachybotrys chartarum IBT 40288]